VLICACHYHDHKLRILLLKGDLTDRSVGMPVVLTPHAKHSDEHTDAPAGAVIADAPTSARFVDATGDDDDNGLLAQPPAVDKTQVILGLVAVYFYPLLGVGLAGSTMGVVGTCRNK